MYIVYLYNYNSYNSCNTHTMLIHKYTVEHNFWDIHTYIVALLKLLRFEKVVSLLEISSCWFWNPLNTCVYISIHLIPALIVGNFWPYTCFWLSIITTSISEYLRLLRRSQLRFILVHLKRNIIIKIRIGNVNNGM